MTRNKHKNEDDKTKIRQGTTDRHTNDDTEAEIKMTMTEIEMTMQKKKVIIKKWWKNKDKNYNDKKVEMTTKKLKW